MFDNGNGQDDFFAEMNSDFSQQDFDDSSADFFDSNQNSSSFYNEQFQPEENPNFEGISDRDTLNFGYKSVGIFVAIALVVLALLILFLSNIKFTKKSSSTKPQVQYEEQVNNSSVETETSKPEIKESSSMISIPSNTYMDYSNEIIQSQGVVSSLTKYLQDGQVIYCINLDIAVGTTSVGVHYYCGYNVFKQVQVGDILNVEYQQVSDTCFSVCTIYK